MTTSHVVALDLGSLGLRALSAPSDRPWEVTEITAVPYPVSRRRHPEALERWFRPEELARRVTGALRASVRAVQAHEGQVTAVAITCQRQAVAFLADGHTAYVGPNSDLRAVFQGSAIDEEMAESLYAQTGHLPSLLFAPAKLRWWRTTYPRRGRRIQHVLSLGAWVAFQLTGEAADVPSLLNEAGLADVTTGGPLALAPALGVQNLLPPRVEEGAVIGTVTPEVAAGTGLLPATPVVLAGPDTQTALLGMGAVAAGQVGVVSGWSTPVQLVTDRPVFDHRRRTWAGRHVVADRWVVEANAGDTGGTLDMVRRMLGRRATGAGFDRLVSRSRLGSNLVTAFWGPQALDLSAPGVGMGGVLAPVPITYNHLHAGHLARASLENTAFAVRECSELVTAVTDQRPRSLGLSGGLARSALFPQLLADVLGTPVRLHHHRASAIGAAIAAAFPRSAWPEAARRAAGRARHIEPDVRSALDYAELYGRWLRLKERLAAMVSEL